MTRTHNWRTPHEFKQTPVANRPGECVCGLIADNPLHLLPNPEDDGPDAIGNIPRENNYLEVGPTIHCFKCGQDVKREEFIKHYDTHAKTEQAYHSAGAIEVASDLEWKETAGEWRERFDKQFQWRLTSKTTGRMDIHAFNEAKVFIAEVEHQALARGKALAVKYPLFIARKDGTVNIDATRNAAFEAGKAAATSDEEAARKTDLTAADEEFERIGELGFAEGRVAERLAINAAIDKLPRRSFDQDAQHEFIDTCNIYKMLQRRGRAPKDTGCKHPKCKITTMGAYCLTCGATFKDTVHPGAGWGSSMDKPQSNANVEDKDIY